MRCELLNCWRSPIMYFRWRDSALAGLHGKGLLAFALAQTVHVDRYDDTNFAAEIDGCDRRRDARHSIPENDWRQVGRFGKAIALWLAGGKGSSGLVARKVGFQRIHSPSGLQAGLVNEGVTNDRVS